MGADTSHEEEMTTRERLIVIETKLDYIIEDNKKMESLVSDFAAMEQTIKATNKRIDDANNRIDYVDKKINGTIATALTLVGIGVTVVFNLTK